MLPEDVLWFSVHKGIGSPEDLRILDCDSFVLIVRIDIDGVLETASLIVWPCRLCCLLHGHQKLYIIFLFLVFLVWADLFVSFGTDP